MTDSLLRDRIVLGIKNGDARKRLLQERKLDLTKCIDICRISESATTQLQAIGASEKVEEVHWVNQSRRANGKPSDPLNHHLAGKPHSHESSSANSACRLMF